MKALQRARRGSAATGQKAAGAKRTAAELGGTSTDPTGIEVMVGEDEEAYIGKRLLVFCAPWCSLCARFVLLCVCATPSLLSRFFLALSSIFAPLCAVC